MFSSLSSNVVLAKARAKYGRRLKDEDYKNLLNCNSVNEIAAYLKNNTVYKEVLVGVDETTIHRGRLETYLREKLFYDFDSLCRYELSSGEKFYQYLISRSVIDQILHSLIHLISKCQQTHDLSMPMFLSRQTKIDMKALSSVKSYDDFLKALENSPYKNLLEEFNTENVEDIDLTAIENKLYTYLFSNVFGIIDKNTKGKAKTDLKDLFNTILDIDNYVRVIRLKRYYQSDPDFIKKMVLPFGYLKKNKLEAIISAEDYIAASAEMNSTSQGKRISKIEYGYINELKEKFRQIISKHYIRFSTNPPVVMLCYIFLAEIELNNIIHIIEGVRYKVPVSEIEKLIIPT